MPSEAMTLKCKNVVATGAQGCQTFFGPDIPNWEKYTKEPQTIPKSHKLPIPKSHKLPIPKSHKLPIPNGSKICIPNGHIMYRHFPFQGPQKFTQIAILCLKIDHLATRQEPRAFVAIDR
jgi:hypothetical protein